MAKKTAKLEPVKKEESPQKELPKGKEVKLDPREAMEKKIQDATKQVNDYLESLGLELRVTHQVSVVPKQQIQRLPVTTTPQPKNE